MIGSIQRHKIILNYNQNHHTIREMHLWVLECMITIIIMHHRSPLDLGRLRACYNKTQHLNRDGRLPNAVLQLYILY